MKATIAPNSYPGQDKPDANIDVWNILVAHDKMSDKMAYDIVKTLFEKKPDLVAVHKEAENIDLKNQTIAVADAVPSRREEVFRRKRHQGELSACSLSRRRSAMPPAGRPHAPTLRRRIDGAARPRRDER